jgi:hypothetical protein
LINCEEVRGPEASIASATEIETGVDPEIPALPIKFADESSANESVNEADVISELSELTREFERMIEKELAITDWDKRAELTYPSESWTSVTPLINCEEVRGPEASVARATEIETGVDTEIPALPIKFADESSANESVNEADVISELSELTRESSKCDDTAISTGLRRPALSCTGVESR